MLSKNRNGKWHTFSQFQIKNQSGEVYLVQENCDVLDANVVKLCVCDTDSPNQGHCASKQKISQINYLIYVQDRKGPMDKGDIISPTIFE